MFVTKRPGTIMGALIFVMFCILFVHGVRAIEVNIQSSECADVLLVFARGSSDNNETDTRPGGLFVDEPFDSRPGGSSNNLTDPPNDLGDVEKVTSAFFRAFKSETDKDYEKITYKAKTIHNEPGLNSNGYIAAPAFGSGDFAGGWLTAPLINDNTIDAGIAEWPWGNFQQSVSDGMDELAGYVLQQSLLCPEQKIVLGGYSQGAKVVAEALNSRISESTIEDHIAGLALFGDPGFDAAATSVLYPLGGSTAFPWVRGNPHPTDEGLNGPRNPYVPNAITHRTISWCFQDDFVCAGVDELVRIQGPGVGHSRYAERGAAEAAAEIVGWLKPHFDNLERERGGKKFNETKAATTTFIPQSEPVDVVLAVNNSAQNGMVDTMRAYLEQAINDTSSHFVSARFGLSSYREVNQGGTLRPIIEKHEPLGTSAHTLNSAAIRKMLNPSGGDDLADHHILAIEKLIMSSSWRDGARKHIVLFTNRPAKESYTYNICNSTIRVSLGDVRSNSCMTSMSDIAGPSSEYSLHCSSVIQALTQAVCSPTGDPYHIFNITRGLSDVLNLARTRGVAVSIVLDQSWDYPTGLADPSNEEVFNQLKSIAESTGGLLLSYDSYTDSALDDSLWKVLNHEPVLPDLKIASITSTEPLTNNPILFDASSSAPLGDKYQWDFNGDGEVDTETSGPATYHSFTVPYSGFINVDVIKNGDVVASAAEPAAIIDGEPEEFEQPLAPDQITALRKADGSIQFNWDLAASHDVLVLTNPLTELPLITSPVSAGGFLVEDGTIFTEHTAHVYAVNEYGQTEPREVQIIEEELPVLEEKNIPVSESAPNSQLTGQGVSGSSLQGNSSSSTLSGSNLQGSSVSNTDNPKPSQFLTQVAGESTEIQQANSLTEAQIAESIDTTRPEETNGMIFPLIAVFAVALFLGIFFFGKYKYKSNT